MVLCVLLSTVGSCILDDGDVLSTNNVRGSAETNVCVSSDGTVLDIGGDDVVNASHAVTDELVSTYVLFSTISDVNTIPEVLSSSACVVVTASVTVTKSSVWNDVAVEKSWVVSSDNVVVVLSSAEVVETTPVTVVPEVL